MISTIAQYSGMVIASVGIVSFIGAIHTLRVNTALTARNKRAEVKIHCIKRYEELSDLRKSLDETILIQNKATQSYFRRHWAIKREQFDFWIDGLVSPRDMISWFMSDVDHFSGDAGGRFTKEAYLDGWRHVEGTLGFVDETFQNFINEIIKIANECSDRRDQRRKLVDLLQEIEASKLQGEIRLNQGKQGRIKISDQKRIGA